MHKINMPHPFWFMYIKTPKINRLTQRRLLLIRVPATV